MSDARLTRRERLELLAWLLDSSIPLPGTRFTIGVDALVGLVPLLGDLVGVALSSLILAEASRLGAPRALLARMAFNVAVDGVAGLVPFLGDAFDAGWKCNQKNVRLLGAWLDSPHRAQRGNRAFVAALVLALAAFVAVCFAGVYFLFTAL